MYGLTTIHKINREADEAHRIIAAHNLAAPKPTPAAPQQPVVAIATKS